MSSYAALSRPRVHRPLVIAAAAALLLAGFLSVARPASAHGSAIDPPSRHYACFKRWGADFQNPIMATQDPMCWQAFETNPDPMWIWNGLIQENVNDDHQARVPDGQLCGGGLSADTALDVPGYWKAQDVDNTFTWTMHDQAKHGAAYIHIYVTKQGFDPTTQKLTWNNLELVKDTGPFPGEGATSDDPLLNGVSYSFPISAPGRTGRHIVYAVWRAGHADQNYYMCSDVRFPGGQPDPTTPGPPPLPADSGCTATFKNTGQWAGTYQAEVTLTAGNAATKGWTVTMQFPNGQSIGQSWNANVAADGPNWVASNVSYNGTLTAGASTTFGIMGGWLAVNNPPQLSCQATT
jgi:lytic cellulose monooxygenase (C4-dehydrogenating)